MRTVVKTIELYTFKEASKDLKERIKENTFSDGWHYEYCFEERLDTLKKYAEYIGGKLDYSIGVTPGRGDYITIKDFDQKLFIKSFKLQGCALTGVCYDDDLIEYLNKFGELQTALNAYLQDIYEEYEFTMSDEYLNELCEANEYEFTINGQLY